MVKEQQLQQSRELLNIYNRLDKEVQDKLINGVKCLVFLQDLADIKDDDADNSEHAAQAV